MPRTSPLVFSAFLAGSGLAVVLGGQETRTPRPAQSTVQVKSLTLEQSSLRVRQGVVYDGYNRVVSPSCYATFGLTKSEVRTMFDVKIVPMHFTKDRPSDSAPVIACVRRGKLYDERRKAVPVVCYAIFGFSPKTVDAMPDTDLTSSPSLELK